MRYARAFETPVLDIGTDITIKNLRENLSNFDWDGEFFQFPADSKFEFTTVKEKRKSLTMSVKMVKNEKKIDRDSAGCFTSFD
jgi:hypothetical protein